MIGVAGGPRQPAVGTAVPLYTSRFNRAAAAVSVPLGRSLSDS
jgi:hypothetical protein